MANPEIQLIQLLVPSALTVIGWLIAAWWALEQVKVAHEGNEKLQRKLINESHRRAVAGELIEIYKSLTCAANNLTQSIFSFSLNHGFEQKGLIEGVPINASNLVSPVNLAYNKMSEEIARLDMWLRISDGHIPETTALSEAINEFHLVFTANGNEGKYQNNPWSGYQGLLTAYQSGMGISDEHLGEVSAYLADAIHQVITKLTEGAALVNRELCG